MDIREAIVQLDCKGHELDQSLPSNRFERRCVRAYAMNAVGRLLASHRTDALYELAEWLCAQAQALAFREPDLTMRNEISEQSISPKDLSQLIRRLIAPRPHSTMVAPSQLETRLDWIISTLHLDYLDAAILKLCVRAVLAEPLHELAEITARRPSSADEINETAIGVLLNRPEIAIRTRLSNRRPLRQLGLMEDRGARDYAPSATVLRIARLKGGEPDRLRAELFGRPRRPKLAWKDFGHLGGIQNFAADLLKGALERQEEGVGILLHGAPGTGKTEFAKTLAKQVDAMPVFIGEADENNEEPSRAERVSHFALTSVLAKGAGRTVLVVDEADDIFTGVDVGDRASRTGSKVFMNRLVETCPAPTIWITNSPERLGPAIMRRMTMAIQFREPGREVRRRMVKRLAARRKVRLDAGELEKLAAVQAPPALLDAGLRAAALTGGGAAAALQGANSLVTALTGAPPEPAPAGMIGFDPALSLADCDLAGLAERAAASFRAGETALSFCFHGLPGTGKSAYARFIAERLGVEIIEKRASDLLSMWLGASEKNIAAAFAEAAERRAMLVLDEADSLLRDRAGAERSWEVSQVNEMLTWMERHPFPFVCTTNAMGSLDSATLRRFLFKVEFLPLNARQAREAFARVFGVAPPDKLDRLELLTPGDFSVVARKAKILLERDADAIVEMLAAEVAAKPEGRRARIGF